ncbi:methylmalonyl-CoA mutase family protein [Metabacillus idriensis]|uniref:methylmalonyl-CoA mutase family protein n=1 Tax=Metabacillus idriensis TaxID=324768 RepID=UPI001749FE8E|nr:methylmalonyl-CoA mutase family protein [Metabacillus idriensis]
MKQGINHEINDFEKVSKQMWIEEAEKALKGKSFHSLSKKTYEGITLQPLYTMPDIQSARVKAVEASQLKNEWSVSQKLQLSETPAQLNEEILSAIKRGQDMIYLENMFYVNSYDDVCTVFEGVDFNQISFHISLKGNVGFFPLFIAYTKNVECKGTFAFDPFGEWIEKGTVNLSKKIEILAEMIEVIEQENLSDVRLVLFSGEIYHNAGASATEELAYTFANAIELLNEMNNRGFSAERLAGRVGFSFSIGSNFFMEIAKFRAAKKIWATILNAFGANHDAHAISLHGTTSSFNKTKNDLHVNMLRTTTESFSAVIGGVDSLTIAPFDEVLGEVSKMGDRIARNTHYILKEESLLSKVSDPAGGSWYIEELTEELAALAWKNIQSIEAIGGFAQAVKQNYIQNKLRDLLEQRMEDVSKRKVHLIGTNYYANIQEQARHIKKSADRKTFTAASVHHELTSLKEWINAAKYLTISEINAMVSEHSDFEITPLMPTRLAVQYEGLRAAADEYKNKFGHYPKVQVVVLGKLLEYKPRLDFLTGMLSAGGMEASILTPDQLKTASPQKPIIVCGKDAAYESFDFGQISEGSIAYLIGRYEKDVLEKRHIEECIHHGMDVYACLKKMQLQLGVASNDSN